MKIKKSPRKAAACNLFSSMNRLNPPELGKGDKKNMSEKFKWR